MKKIQLILLIIFIFLFIKNAQLFSQELTLEKSFTIPILSENFDHHNLYTSDRDGNIFYLHTGIREEEKKLVRQLVKINADGKQEIVFVYADLLIKEDEAIDVIRRNEQIFNQILGNESDITGYYGKIYSKIEESKSKIQNFLPFRDLAALEFIEGGFVFFYLKYSYILAQFLEKTGKPRNEGLLFRVYREYARGLRIPIKVDKKGNFFIAFLNHYDSERNYWSIIKLSRDGEPIFRWRLKNISQNKISQFEYVDLDQTKIDLEHRLAPYLESLEEAKQKGDKEKIAFLEKLVRQNKDLFSSHYHAAEIGKEKIEKKRAQLNDPFKGKSAEFATEIKEITCFEVSDKDLILFDKESGKFIIVDTEENKVSEYYAYIDEFKNDYIIQDMMLFNNKLYTLFLPHLSRPKEIQNPKLQIYDFSERKYCTVKYCSVEDQDLLPRQPFSFLKYLEKENLFAITPKREGQIKILRLDNVWKDIGEYK